MFSSQGFPENIYEELSQSDKSDIKDMIGKEFKSRAIKDLIEDELAKLFKKKDGTGRIAAFEVMVCSPPIKNLIREAKIHQIPSVMQTAQREGMISMEKSIEGLVASGVINIAETKT